MRDSEGSRKDCDPFEELPAMAGPVTIETIVGLMLVVCVLCEQVRTLGANLELTRDRVAEGDIRTTSAHEQLARLQNHHEQIEHRVGTAEADLNDHIRRQGGSTRG